ncbi:MAG: hypothetical protein JO257_14245, partial [Deltaproteobacteria bacterium]|nr:hypothetical protein [Deltaproteobacteria bacterium]
MSGDGFDVVVVVGSLGAEGAIVSILKALPRDLAVPVVVMQHLSPDSEVVAFYGKRLEQRAVEWFEEGAALAPGKVHVCPPRSFVELLPNGTCRLAPCGGGSERPMDRLFESVARSFAHRAIGVVLTGMGSDGAIGACELHRAGGRVIVQSPESAKSQEMPRAAIAAGASDLIVGLPDIAQIIGEIVAGTPRPKARSELDAVARIFGSAGEIARTARDKDWALTPLGPALGWATELRALVRTMIESAHPTAIWWGRELIQIYNEPWRKLLGASKHPTALGQPARETWLEIWDEIEAMVDRAMNAGVASSAEDRRIVVERDGRPEEAYFTFEYSPIRDATGAVCGVHHTAIETTSRVVAERRLGALRALASGIAGAATLRQACEQAVSALGAYPLDVPFVLLYLLDPDSRQATLAAATVAPGSPEAPHVVSLADERAVWPIARVVQQGPTLVRGEHETRPAFLVPLRLATKEAVIGVLIAGVAAHRPFDESYRQFIEIVAQQIDAGLTHAQAKQLERE